MKRSLDLAVGCLAFAACLIPMLAIALLIRITDGSPVLLVQRRPGLRGIPLALYKFRTMRDTVDKDGNYLADEDRLTPIGRLLRKLSLDELPQIINVITGNMSLVGPRPLLMEYLPLYSPEQARRHEVKPGITGWTQVNGRNALTWDEKFALDVWYVDHRSFLLDMKILWLTVASVFRSKEVSAPGHVTMPKFNGSGGTEGP